MSETYIAIDLKSFYASVECVRRKRNPLTTHLVVADVSKTEKTICLAVSPSLKKYGIAGRARLFEVIQKVNAINQKRLRQAPGHRFHGESDDEAELAKDPGLALAFIAAPPHMAQYVEISARIHEIYLHYVSPEDIHVYSIDEVFIDASGYQKTSQQSPREFTRMIIQEILNATGITATAGIGSNLYLCKVAMDIVAKHTKADENGVRIAEIDPIRYRKYLWDHRPITDFWRVGKGYAKRLEEVGLYTMGDIAKCSIGKEDAYYNEDLLYRLFGINAELLIDHAWGYESCTMKDIKSYQPSAHSLGSGQVLSCPYPFAKARLIVKEMMDSLALELVEKGLVCDQIILVIGYDKENLMKESAYDGEVTTDFYGRRIPKHAHGSAKLSRFTASSKLFIEAAMSVFDEIVDKRLTIRRINVAANHVIEEAVAKTMEKREQMDLFTDYEKEDAKEAALTQALEKEKKLQQATVNIKKRFGKNAVLKGMNLEEGAKAIERNGMIGGHKA